MPTLRRLLSSTLAILLSATLAAFPMVAQATVIVGVPLMGIRAEAPAAVLGLDGKDDAANESFTQALRKAFAARNLSGGPEMSLMELRLTMGCDNNSAECLSEAGKTIDVSRLVYGTLNPASGGGYRLELFILNVETGVIDAQTVSPLTAADLSADRIDDTAVKVVGSLFPEEDDPEALPPVVGGDGDPGGKTQKPDKKQSRSRLVWGKHKPIPKWKIAGVAVSATIFAAAAATAGGLSWAISDNGPIREDLLDAAADSLTDDNPDNNIDPMSNGDLCAQARTPPQDMPDRVTNASVTKACNKADSATTAANVMWGLTVVAGVSTIIFTTLIFVRREETAAAAAMRKRRIRLGAGPTPGGGFTLGGGFKF